MASAYAKKKQLVSILFEQESYMGDLNHCNKSSLQEFTSAMIKKVAQQTR